MIYSSFDMFIYRSCLIKPRYMINRPQAIYSAGSHPSSVCLNKLSSFGVAVPIKHDDALKWT